MRTPASAAVFTEPHRSPYARHSHRHAPASAVVIAASATRSPSCRSVTIPMLLAVLLRSFALDYSSYHLNRFSALSRTAARIAAAVPPRARCERPRRRQSSPPHRSPYARHSHRHAPASAVVIAASATRSPSCRSVTIPMLLAVLLRSFALDYSSYHYHSIVPISYHPDAARGAFTLVRSRLLFLSFFTLVRSRLLFRCFYARSLSITLPIIIIYARADQLPSRCCSRCFYARSLSITLPIIHRADQTSRCCSRCFYAFAPTPVSEYDALLVTSATTEAASEGQKEALHR